MLFNIFPAVNVKEHFCIIGTTWCAIHLARLNFDGLKDESKITIKFALLDMRKFYFHEDKVLKTCHIQLF